MATTPSVSAGAGVRRYTAGVARRPGILSGMCSALLPLSRDFAASESRLGSDGCASVPAPYQPRMGWSRSVWPALRQRSIARSPPSSFMRTAPRLSCRRVNAGPLSANETLRVDANGLTGPTACASVPT